MKLLAILAIIIVPLLILGGCTVSKLNQEVKLRNQFTQKYSERTAFYDKMWKVLNQKSQIAVKNDSSFRKNVDIIMSGRKDAQNVFFKWITESNPNANYSEVSVLYKDLSRAVESQREGFFEQEKFLQDVKLQHDNLMDVFPGSIVFTIFGRSKLKYTPITSDRTDTVISSGKDNETELFE